MQGGDQAGDGDGDSKLQRLSFGLFHRMATVRFQLGPSFCMVATPSGLTCTTSKRWQPGDSHTSPMAKVDRWASSVRRSTSAQGSDWGSVGFIRRRSEGQIEGGAGRWARELPPLGPADGARSGAVGVAALGWGFFLPRRVFFLGNF
jgi:hypothetical protein